MHLDMTGNGIWVGLKMRGAGQEVLPQGSVSWYVSGVCFAKVELPSLT